VFISRCSSLDFRALVVSLGKFQERITPLGPVSLKEMAQNDFPYLFIKAMKKMKG